MVRYKRRYTPYTLDEDTTILKMIVETKSFYILRGTLFWKDLAVMGVLNRTWQSLKERFIKNILPIIFDDKFEIPEAHKRKIFLGFEQTKRRKKCITVD